MSEQVEYDATMFRDLQTLADSTEGNTVILGWMDKQRLRSLLAIAEAQAATIAALEGRVKEMESENQRLGERWKLADETRSGLEYEVVTIRARLAPIDALLAKHPRGRWGNRGGLLYVAADSCSQLNTFPNLDDIAAALNASAKGAGDE